MNIGIIEKAAGWSIQRKKIFIIFISAVCFFILSTISQGLTFGDSPVVPIWLPSGFSLAFALLYGPYITIGCFLGGVIQSYQILHGIPALNFTVLILCIVMVNVSHVLQALLGHGLVIWLMRDEELFTRPAHLPKFLLAASTACLLSAVMGVLVLTMVGITGWNEAILNIGTWFISDTAGILVLSPLILLWNRRHKINWNPARILELAGYICVTVILYLAIFEIFPGVRIPQFKPYIFLPLMLWADFRFSPRIINLNIAGLAITSIAATIFYQGPFYLGGVHISLLSVQLFLIMCAVTNLTIYTVITEARNTQERVLEESEKRLKYALEKARYPIAIITEEQILYANQVALDMFGISRDEIKKYNVADFTINPQEKEEIMETIARHGVIQEYELKLRNIEGQVFWVVISAEGFSFEGKKALFVSIIDISHIKQKESDLLERVSLLTTKTVLDPLTNTWNRLKFNELFALEREKADKQSLTFSLLFFDLDDFKKINDHYGHNIGDIVLAEMAGLVKSSLRKDDALFRWGGEEFIILASGTEMESAVKVAEKLRAKVEEHVFQVVGRVTLSIGIAEYNRGEEIDTLIERADAALYKAKKNGKNRVEVYTGMEHNYTRPKFRVTE